MTNTKNTKRALLSSVLALFLCFAMLLGTTFAWFTDSVYSGNNNIVTGNLDVELEYLTKDGWKTVSDATDLFSDELWEPGHTEVVYLKLSNLGSLALKYKLGVNIVSETYGTNMIGNELRLSDYIYYDVIEGVDGFNTPFESREEAVAAAEMAKQIKKSYSKDGEMSAGEDALYMALVVYMPTWIGNEANHKTGTDAPEINLGINVVVTQLAAEQDSFGSEYDNDATYTAEMDALREKLAAAKPGDTVTYDLSHDAYVTSSIVVPNDVKLVLNGNGNKLIANTRAVIQAENADLEVSDLTITGKATYAIFTKGARWDYNGVHATVNATLTNVTVDLLQANNFPVTFNGMGNITMKDCTVKGAGLPSGDYADGMHVFAGAEINLTVDGGEIGGIMLNSNYAAAATMDVKNGAVIEKVDLEVSSASDGSNVVAPVTVSADSTVKDMFHAVYSANQLVKVLEAGGNALLVNNITTSNKLTVKDGAYLDGNGKTIDFAGNFNGYEKALNLEGGATVKNLNVANAGRAYGSDGNDGDIYLDNISGTNAHYFFNGDTTTNSNVYVTNSTLDGWISYGNANLFSFDNCVLKGETSRFYGICYFVVYSDAEFKNCTFDNFYMAMNQGAVNSGATGSVVTITNCVYVTSEGTVKVTADNFKSLLMGPGDEADFNRMLNNATIIVDGVTVAN